MTALGIALVLVGAALLVAEAHLPTAGVLGGVGTVALVAGAVLAIAASAAGLAVALPVGIVAGGAGAGFVALIAHKAGESRRLKVASGAEGLLGHVGEVRSWEEPVGQVAVDGALWRARHSLGEMDGELRPGDPVVVDGVSGLTLSVRRAEEWEVAR